MPGHERLAQKRRKNQETAANNCKSIKSFFGQSTSSSTTSPNVTLPVQVDGELVTATTTTTTDNVVATPEIAKKQSKSKHAVGRKAVLELNYEWIIIREELHETQNVPVLYCKLCQKHKTFAANGNKTWVSEGFKSLRKDRVKDHAGSVQHLESIRRDKQLTLNLANVEPSEDEQTVAKNLIDICLHMVNNNMPLESFPGLVDLCIRTGAPKLIATRKSFNATYTSPRSVHELLDVISETVDEHYHVHMKCSPTYSIMIDEACDKASIKNLGVVIKYIDPDGMPTVKFLHDSEMTRSTGLDIKTTALEVITSKSLDPKQCSNLTSDGASSFTGKRNGAAALLKQDAMPNAVVMHCHDHRLALACRDAFNTIKQLDSVSEGLDSLHKYYKYSSVSAATLRHLQDVYKTAHWRIQQAKHHRWLSYDKAVLVVLSGLKIIREDLENAASCETKDEFSRQRKTDATALFKWITQEKTIRILCLLGDVLPCLAELSLVFQRRSVDLSYIQPKLEQTLAHLRTRQASPGSWERKLLHDTHGNNTPKLTRMDCSEDDFTRIIRLPFLNELEQKIKSRFENIEVVSSLAALSIPLDVLDALPAIFRHDEIRSLAVHFSIDENVLVEEWVGWLEFVKVLEFPSADISISPLLVLGKMLLQRNSSSSEDLKDKFPNVTYLYSVANSLCLSSAEVERLFSHLKIIKSDRRTSLSNKVLNWLLNIKLNIDVEVLDQIREQAARKWLRKRTRRFAQYTTNS